MRTILNASPRLLLATAVLLAGWGVRAAQAQQPIGVRVLPSSSFALPTLGAWMQPLPNPYMYFVKQADGQPVSFWIGVATDPTDATLQSQLGLAEGQGLIVRDVVEDGPAAKAGLKRHDVLVTANGKSLGKIEDLVGAVNQTKTDTLKLKLIRGGKQISLELQASQRPADVEAVIPNVPQEVRKLLDEMRLQNGQPMQLRFFGPGMVTQHAKLPDNLSISITRQGDQPAKISVKRGDKQWEVTEKELEQLPEDIRGHVQPFLGQGLGDFNFKFQGLDQMPPKIYEQIKKYTPPQVRVERHRTAPPQGDLQQQMQQLRNDLNELRKSLKNQESEREALLKTLRQLLEKTQD